MAQELNIELASYSKIETNRTRLDMMYWKKLPVY
ncbi:hypothetical protein BH11BAC5_BH11BAC5_06890 [soil metagenome]